MTTWTLRRVMDEGAPEIDWSAWMEDAGPIREDAWLDYLKALDCALRGDLEGCQMYMARWLRPWPKGDARR